MSHFLDVAELGLLGVLAMIGVWFLAAWAMGCIDFKDPTRK